MLDDPIPNYESEVSSGDLDTPLEKDQENSEGIVNSEEGESVDQTPDSFLNDLENVLGNVNKAAEDTAKEALPDPLTVLRIAMDSSLCRTSIEQDILTEALFSHTKADEWEHERGKKVSGATMGDSSLENSCVMFNGIGLLKNALERRLQAVKRVHKVTELILLKRFAESSDERLIGMVVRCLDGKAHSFFPEIDDIPTVRKDKFEEVTAWLKERNYHSRVSSSRWKFRELQKLIKELDEASIALPDGLEVISRMTIKSTIRKTI